MRENKRKKLDAKGWKIGTAKDFLGMSDEEESYVNLRLKLAEGLKTRRQAPWGHSERTRSGHQVQAIASCKDGGGRPNRVSRPARQVTICAGCVEPGTGGDHFSTLKHFHFWCIQSNRSRRGFSSRKAAPRRARRQSSLKPQVDRPATCRETWAAAPARRAAIPLTDYQHRQGVTSS